MGSQSIPIEDPGGGLGQAGLEYALRRLTQQAQAGRGFVLRTALAHPKKLWWGFCPQSGHTVLPTCPWGKHMTQARPEGPGAQGKFSYMGVGAEGPTEAQTTTGHWPPHEGSPSEKQSLPRWLRWLECRPNTPRLWVQSLVRTHTRINQ